ncbi:MFS transporter [Micrococcus sp. FDAARGOS_333]|uniref:MFS transporter n=1 Tax=Micrococcus sp. FDAARGOS_333 TaxID=1930558 RepID=UPI000B4DFE90|nr:MFS transporter [Micrococcus sp. FDAARGOS_333]PNL17689.1 MFS transporter [Micrococcus sp. FDAARGOS_333]
MSTSHSVNRLPRGITPFVTVRFFGFLADQGSTFVIPLAVYSVTASTTLSGIAFTIQWLPRIVLSPFFGTFVDRFPSLPQLVSSDLVRTIVLLVVLIEPEAWTLIASCGVLAIANGYSSIVTEQVVGTAVNEDKFAQAQSQQQMAFQTAMVAGPALGSWALGLLSLRGALLFFALTSILALLATPLVLSAVGHPQVTGGEAGPWERLRDGGRTLFQGRQLPLLMAITILVNLTGGMALATLPPIVVGQLGGGAASAGTVAGTAAAVSLTSAALCSWGTRATDIGRMVAVAGVILAVAAVTMSIASSLILFAIGYSLWAGGLVVFTIWMRTRRLELINPQKVGTTLGFFVAVILVATPLSGLLLTLLGDKVGAQSLLQWTALVSAALVVPLLVQWKRVHRSQVPNR